jgi:hypothetical protein
METKYIGYASRSKASRRLRDDRQEYSLQFSAALAEDLLELLDGALIPTLAELHLVLSQLSR